MLLYKSPPCQVGSYWSCVSRNIKYLICHLTLPNRVIKGSVNFMCGNPSLFVPTLVTRFGDHRYCHSRNVFSLSRDLARARDYKVMGLSGWKFHKVSHQLTKFGDYRQGGSGDIMVLVCHVILHNHVN